MAGSEWANYPGHEAMAEMGFKLLEPDEQLLEPDDQILEYLWYAYMLRGMSDGALTYARFPMDQHHLANRLLRGSLTLSGRHTLGLGYGSSVTIATSGVSQAYTVASNAYTLTNALGATYVVQGAPPDVLTNHTLLLELARVPTDFNPRVLSCLRNMTLEQLREINWDHRIAAARDTMFKQVGTMRNFSTTLRVGSVYAREPGKQAWWMPLLRLRAAWRAPK